MGNELRHQTLKVAEAYQKLLRVETIEEWINLWADDAVMEYPYADRKLQGKQQIIEYTRQALSGIAIDGFDSLQMYPMENPEMVVAEVSIRGRYLPTGNAYNQKYVIFFEVKGGKLARYREYWNPVIFAEAANKKAE